MRPFEKNRLKTEQAWQQLYNRLEQEGLLFKKKEHKPILLFRKPIQWAALIAVVCMSVVTLIFIGKADMTSQPLLTLQNGINTPTLVTTLEDGSVIYLADDTKIQYPEHFPVDKREITLNGTALFEISKNRVRPFIIETEKIQVEVLGTTFHVRSSNHSPFELSVKQGEVKVMSKNNGQMLHVKASETVQLLSEHLHLEPTKDATRFTRYLEKIQFKDERLADILHVINKRYSDLTLETTHDLGEKRLTVSLYNDSPDTIAELICIALNLKCRKEGKRLILTEP